ncbi:MAG TPA: hypothetical protein VLM41_04730, partial [Steroidobacteraceae bacterium]|nr:hypothetical protein [Steroidobacteraceae bacterium]
LPQRRSPSARPAPAAIWVSPGSPPSRQSMRLALVADVSPAQRMPGAITQWTARDALLLQIPIKPPESVIHPDRGRHDAEHHSSGKADLGAKPPSCRAGEKGQSIQTGFPNALRAKVTKSATFGRCEHQ